MIVKNYDITKISRFSYDTEYEFLEKVTKYLNSMNEMITVISVSFLADCAIITTVVNRDITVKGTIETKGM